MTTSTPTRTAIKAQAGTIEVGDFIAKTKKMIEAGGGKGVGSITSSKEGTTLRFITPSGEPIFEARATTDLWVEDQGGREPTEEEGGLPESGPDHDTRDEDGRDEEADQIDKSVNREQAERLMALTVIAARKRGYEVSDAALKAVALRAIEEGHDKLDDIDLDIVLGGIMAEVFQPTSLQNLLGAAGIPRTGGATIHKVLEELEINGEDPATHEVLGRLADRVGGKQAGLTGKAALLWILTGQSSKEQATAARTTTEAKMAGEKATRRSQNGGPREGSTLAGVIAVLTAASEPMRPPEVYAEMKRRKLDGSLKGKTPEATVAAQMAVASKAGKHGIHRPEKGRYAVKSGS